MRTCWHALLMLVSLFACASSGWGQAQITSGTVQGNVFDETGASVADATIETRNLDTNFTETNATNADGHFAFLSLTPGRYWLTISKRGFATVLQENVNLTVGQVISIPVTMKISSVIQQIVVFDVPVVDTGTTESASTLDEIAVAATPVLGRKFESLLTLTPGVSISQGPDGDEININGQRGIFNNVSLDGGDYNNGFFGEQAGGQRAAIDITLEAVKEFQVTASGANAEFGRTAGGVINVITKSGTNDIHGAAFEYFRTEALTAAASNGTPLTDFRRNQFGGSIGGPIIKNKLFFFAASEEIHEDLTRANLSVPIGNPCAVSNPVFGPGGNITDAQISASPDCQRQVLLDYYRANFGDNEGLPIDRQVRNADVFGRIDYILNSKHQIFSSYNFDWSKNPNQTFDVPTYGDSANGIEGPAHIQNVTTNWLTILSSNKLNEAHFNYSRETRPREAIDESSVPDTGIGSAPSFRFGQPFFLEPSINELTYRTDVRDNFSLVMRKHTWKFGGEWLHTRNTQVFRGFFNGRYIFGDVPGFLHYASPATLGSGFGPTTAECADGTFTDLSLVSGGNCPDGSASSGSPLLFYLQEGPAHAGETKDQAGATDFANQDFSLFGQDTWKIWRNVTLNYGLRWDAQHFPDPVIPPSQTAYGVNLSNPNFPSTGRLPNQWKEFQPRVGVAWDVRGNGKSVLRASWGIFNARQNMLTQTDAIAVNGVQQSAVNGLPTYPGTLPLPVLQPGQFQPGAGVFVFSKDYANPRIYTTSVGYERQIAGDYAAYADFVLSKGVHLTRFINPNVGSTVTIPENGDTVSYSGPVPFPNLGVVTVTASSAKSLYRGLTIGLRKRLGHRFMFDGNYTYSVDKDDDSNERDPFTFRYANLFNLADEYANSDRDERHRFNFYTVTNLPWGLNGTIRMQAHSAEPITDVPDLTPSGPPCSITNSNTRFVDGVDCGRNHLRKDNAFFTFDFGIDRPIHLGERFQIVPRIEMFNTFNNTNNVNPLSSPALFDFSGFLRVGVGDPRQAQLSMRFQF